MKSTIFLILGLVLFATIRADSSSKSSGEDSGESKGKGEGHYEMLFEKEKAIKSFYVNIKTKSLWSLDLANELFILVDGASGAGLIVKMKSMKGWKLSKGWKASGGDLVKSIKEYLIKVKSFEELKDKKEKEIDLIKEQVKVEWVIKKIVVNIIDKEIKNPDLRLLINLSIKALASKKYASLYLSQKDKGIKVGSSLTSIQKIEYLLKPILSGIDIKKEKLSKIKIKWSKIYAYKGEFVGAAMLLIEEISINLKKEIKSVQKGFLVDVTKSCAKIVKAKGGKGGKGSGSGSESGSSESDDSGSKDKGSGSNESD